MIRWFRSLRETIRVLAGRDDSVQKYIAETKLEIVKLREQRAAQAQQLEAKTLAEVRRVVEELKTVKESIDQAEKAAIDYVEQVSSHADVLLAEAIKAEGKVLEDILAAKSASGLGGGKSPLLDESMTAAEREKLMQWMSALKVEDLPLENQLHKGLPGGQPPGKVLDMEALEKLIGKKPG